MNKTDELYLKYKISNERFRNSSKSEQTQVLLSLIEKITGLCLEAGLTQEDHIELLKGMIEISKSTMKELKK